MSTQTQIENHPVIIHIVENHAAIYKRMQAAIRKHRREQRAAEARTVALGICPRQSGDNSQKTT